MRMKMVCDDRTLREVANEFLALKKAQKVRERTLNDYKKYIDMFLVMDRGFYSGENLRYLTEQGCRFVIALPGSLDTVQS